MLSVALARYGGGITATQSLQAPLRTRSMVPAQRNVGVSTGTGDGDHEAPMGFGDMEDFSQSDDDDDDITHSV